MRSSYWLLAAALFAGSVQAVPNYGPGFGPGVGPGMGPGMGPGANPYMRGPVRGAQRGGPALALRSGMDKLLAFLGSEEGPSQEALAGFLNTEIAPFFDFEYMARTAGGRLFSRLGEEEQADMVEQIKRSFLGKMAEKLAGYQQQQVRFLPPRGGNDGRTAQVSAAIMNPGSYPARLDFRLYRKGDQWLVYDVSANGQSAIVHYRNELMRQMRQSRMQQMRRMSPPAGPAHPGMGYAPGPMR